MPEPVIRVRQVDFADAADAAAWLDQLDAYARDPMGGGSPLPAAVRRRLPADLAGRPGTYALLADLDDRTVGFATCFLGYSTFQARPLLNIHDIAVLRAQRGRGVAHALLDAIAELGRSLDCCRVTLEVRDDNPRARKVYEAAGFAPATCPLFMQKAL